MPHALPVVVTRAHLRAAAAHGAHIGDLEERVAKATHGERVPIDVHVTVLLEVIERTGMRDLPATVALGLPVDALGILGFLVSTQRNLGVGLAVTCRNLEVWMDAVRLRSTMANGLEIRIEIDHTVLVAGTFPHDILCEVLLARLVGVGRELIGRPDWFPPSMACPATSIDTLGRVLGSDALEQGAPGVRVDRESCAIPCVNAHPAMAAYFEAAVKSAIEEKTHRDEVLRRVYEVLSLALPVGGGNIEDVADALHMSTRTLQRQLRERDLSFAQVKEDYRRAMGVRLLSSPEAGVGAVAVALGYDDVGSFHRAFRRWVGVPPAAWRDSIQR